MKTLIGRCLCIVIGVFLLRWQGAEAWEASAFALLWAQLVFPNEPVNFDENH